MESKCTRILEHSLSLFLSPPVSPTLDFSILFPVFSQFSLPLQNQLLILSSLVPLETQTHKLGVCERVKLIDDDDDIIIN